MFALNLHFTSKHFISRFRYLLEFKVYKVLKNCLHKGNKPGFIKLRKVKYKEIYSKGQHCDNWVQ